MQALSAFTKWMVSVALYFALYFRRVSLSGEEDRQLGSHSNPQMSCFIINVMYSHKDLKLWQFQKTWAIVSTSSRHCQHVSDMLGSILWHRYRTWYQDKILYPISWYLFTIDHLWDRCRSFSTYHNLTLRSDSHWLMCFSIRESARVVNRPYASESVCLIDSPFLHIDANCVSFWRK